MRCIDTRPFMTTGFFYLTSYVCYRQCGWGFLHFYLTVKFDHTGRAHIFICSSVREHKLFSHLCIYLFCVRVWTHMSLCKGQRTTCCGWSTVWVPGTEENSSISMSKSFNCWAMSPAPFSVRNNYKYCSEHSGTKYYVVPFFQSLDLHLGIELLHHLEPLCLILRDIPGCIAQC